MSTGKAQWRPAQGTWPSHIREIQRKPLALTSWLRLERHALTGDGRLAGAGPCFHKLPAIWVIEDDLYLLQVPVRSWMPS